MRDGKGHLIIKIPAHTTNQHKQYGMGFYMSNKWIKRFVKAEWVSDRIAVIKFKIHQKKNKYLTILNVYGPTGVQARAGNEAEVSAFYDQLNKEVRKQKRTSAIVSRWSQETTIQ